MTKTSWLLNSLLLLAMTTGCDEPDALNEDFGDGDVAERCTGCGIKLNTNKLGDFEFSELDINYNWWNGVKLESVFSQELGVVDQVFVKEGALYARKNGKVWPDKYLNQSIWKLSLDDGSGIIAPVTMQLKAFGYDNGNRTYTFWNNRPSKEGGKEGGYNCDDDPSIQGDQFGAILSNDIVIDPTYAVVKTEPSKIYFGCLSGGVGKAAKWGYPSYKHTNIEFETAVRVVRADYCGNGVSFTKPGNAIQLKDVYGVSGFVNPSGKTEAIWDDTGAFCIGAPRWVSVWPDAQSVQKQCELMGVESPKICEDGMDLGSTPNAMFWSKNP